MDTPQESTTQSSSPGTPRVRKSRPFLEIQYHPGDIRKGVRYFFLSRRRVVGTSLGLLLYAAFLGYSLWVIPMAIRAHLDRNTHRELLAEREVLGEILQERVAELEAVAKTSDALRFEMDQIHLAYGFPGDPALGKGGYPHEPSPVPANSIYSAEVRRGNGLTAMINEQHGALDALLSEVQSFEEMHRDQVRTTPSISPVKREEYVLTSPFGMRISPFTKERDFHAGIDFAAAIGTPIYAPSDGVVSYAGRYPMRKSVAWWRYGNLVAIKHGDRFVTLYGHCDEVKVKQGQKVKQGDLIATVGDTGWSTNPHLHYEVRRLDETGEGGQDFKPIDPRIYILDQEWRDQEQLLINARQAPDPKGFEPLPRLIRR